MTTIQTVEVFAFASAALLSIGGFFWVLYDSIKNDVPKFLSVQTLSALAIYSAINTMMTLLFLNGSL